MKSNIEAINDIMKVYLKVENYKVKLLKEDNLKQINDLCSKSKDYFILDQGVEPSDITSKDILEALPPGMGYEDKFVIGYFDHENTLVALIDLIKNYPMIQKWTLGLILIDPSYRKKGLGAKIHQNLEGWIAKQSGKSIRIGVLDDNEAINFWKKTGYQTVKESILKRDGKKDKGVLIMEYLIH